MYRYMLVVYQYTLATTPFCVTCTNTCLGCTGTPVPIWHFFYFFYFFHFFSFSFCFVFFCLYIYIYIYIYLQIGSSSADVKSVLVDCLPSRVSLHAHLSFCSYSTQTDCIHGVGHYSSFFGHFHSFHRVHYFSNDQGS